MKEDGLEVVGFLGGATLDIDCLAVDCLGAGAILVRFDFVGAGTGFEVAVLWEAVDMRFAAGFVVGTTMTASFLTKTP